MVLLLTCLVLELALDCTRICLRDPNGKEIVANDTCIDEIMFLTHCNNISPGAEIASVRCMTNILNLNSEAVRDFVRLNGFTWLITILQSSANVVKMFYLTRLLYMLIVQR